MEATSSIEPVSPAQQPSPSSQNRPRHVRTASAIRRRSTNACRRCKRRKIKCYYNRDDSNSKCVACSKSYSECLFDVPPDGVLRGHTYVTTLEARIKSLERQLCGKNSEQSMTRDRPNLTPSASDLCHLDQPASEPAHGVRHAERNWNQKGKHHGSMRSPLHRASRETPSSQCSSQQGQLPEVLGELPSRQQPLKSDFAFLGMLHSRTTTSDLNGESLPTLPPNDRARELVDAVYFYTQARYCIIDWIQLREWHQDREDIAYTSTEGSVASQTGAFFIWIIYAIGACLVPNPENSTEAYFARARIYLPAVMASQGLTTVQALLCVVQYYYRAPNESPIWDLVGVALRLCVKLRYHRKTTSSPDAQGLAPYTVELQKRFFWCAYCFDRLISMMSKLPFGIRDSDIDVDIPVNIDDTCTDQQKIHDLQIKQESGDTSQSDGTITTMTSALHHLQMYRIRSRILTNFVGPHAQVPSLTDVAHLLSDLDKWRQQAPRKQDLISFPHQNPDRIQANYLQAVLLLIRPILTGNTIDPDLVGLCVEFAADACESAKTLSLNPLTHPDRITVYHCFYSGVTLLQCLAIKPTALTPRRAHQAISACLSALAVYTRVLPAVAPFLRIFEEVSNRFVCENHHSEVQPSLKTRNLLNRIVSSDPSEATGILHSLSSHQESQQATSAPTPVALGEPMPAQYDSILGGQSTVVPLEMPLDISPLYAPDAEIMDMWTGSWLDTLSTEFS